MTWLWSLLQAALPVVLGLFGYAPKKDPGDVERKVGEDLGATRAAAKASDKELEDAKRAIDASRGAAAADDTGGLRDGHDGDRKWNPDGVG